MFNLTRQEKQAVLFVSISLMIGGFVTLYSRYRADFAPDLALNGPAAAIAAADTAFNLEPMEESLPADGKTPRASAVAEPRQAININTATRAQLQTLPGIGPALAGRIVVYRQNHDPFQTVDQLVKVKGIGPATLARLRGYVTVE